MLHPNTWVTFSPIKKLLAKHKNLGKAHVLAMAHKLWGRYEVTKAEVAAVAAALAKEPSQELDTDSVPEDIRVHAPKLTWWKNPEREMDGTGTRRRQKVLANLWPMHLLCAAFKLHDPHPNDSWRSLVKASRPQAEPWQFNRRTENTLKPLPANTGLKRLYWLVKKGDVVLVSGQHSCVVNVHVRASDYPVLDVLVGQTELPTPDP